LFRQAYVAYDTVCWPGNLDIAQETCTTDRGRWKAGHLHDASDRVGALAWTLLDNRLKSDPQKLQGIGPDLADESFNPRERQAEA